jgi:predicted branched-subunit amino acid permease
MTSSPPPPPPNPLAPGTVIPIVLAIGVFGTLYGAAAQPLFGSWLTMLSSIVIFSGTVQFSMIGLLAAGAGPVAILWAIFVVNVRNFALGGALRPHLTGARRRRLAVSWFLIDETVGLALASPTSADRILLRAGAAAYLSWVVGTAIGVAGGAAFGLAGMAAAIFPVLFIGLTALMVRSRGALARAGMGAAVTLVLLLVWPGLAGLAPVLGGIVAAIPAAGGE